MKLFMLTGCLIFAICAVELSYQQPPKPDPKPDPKPEPKPDPKPEPKPDPKPDPKPVPDPQPSAPTPYACPDKNHLGDKCACYPSVFYMVCNGLTKDSIVDFVPTKSVKVKTLIIQNSPQLPDILDHFDEQMAFTTDSLVVVQSEKITTPVANLVDILRFVTKSLEIVGNKDMVLELGFLPNSLESLTIENVKELKNFKVAKYEKLTSLELKSVQMEEPVLLFPATGLKRLTITGNNALAQVIGFAPKACAATDSAIQIILRGNPKLTSFDFTQLFKIKECKFNIDLSQNPTMDANLLASQVKELSAANLKPDSLYLVLRDTKQNCKKCVADFYKTRPDYIHSVKCIKPAKFLDQVKPEEQLDPCT